MHKHKWTPQGVTIPLLKMQVLREKMSQKNSMISTPSTFSQAVCEAPVTYAFLEYQIIHSMTFPTPERTRIQN